METKSVTTAEFIRHFGQYHDEAQKTPITLTKHGRASVVILSAEIFEKLTNQEDQRSAHEMSSMPADHLELFGDQLERLADGNGYDDDEA